MRTALETETGASAQDIKKTDLLNKVKLARNSAFWDDENIGMSRSIYRMAASCFMYTFEV